MKIPTLMKQTITASVLALTMYGCGDGGTSATGIGLSVHGNWSGKLSINSIPFSTFTMSLSQPSANLNKPFEDSKVTGTFSSSRAEIPSGDLSGDLQGNTIVLTRDKLTMTGSVTANSMKGSWSILAIESSSDDDDSSIALSGTWSASR